MLQAEGKAAPRTVAILPARPLKCLFFAWRLRYYLQVSSAGLDDIDLFSSLHTIRVSLFLEKLCSESMSQISSIVVTPLWALQTLVTLVSRSKQRITVNGRLRTGRNGGDGLPWSMCIQATKTGWKTHAVQNMFSCLRVQYHVSNNM